MVSTAMGMLLLLVSPLAVFAQTSNTTAGDDAPAFVAAVGADASANWAGYVANETGSTYTSVSATWTVPHVSTASTTGSAADATWVGIGGVSSHDLIQAGTQALVQNNSVTYQAWYELLPDYQTRIALAVHPGDSVSVSIHEVSPDKWEVIFINNTTGQKYQKTFSYESSRSSAEWIQERPVGATGRRLSYIPLDNFGSVTFTGANAVVDGTDKSLGDLNAAPLIMLGSRSETLAVPSRLNADGTGFTVARADVRATASVRAQYARPSHRTIYQSGDGTTVIKVMLW